MRGINKRVVAPALRLFRHQRYRKKPTGSRFLSLQSRLGFSGVYTNVNFAKTMSTAPKPTLGFQNHVALGTAGALFLAIGIASYNYGEAKEKEDIDQANQAESRAFKSQFRNDQKSLIFTGNANVELANAIGSYLGVDMSEIKVGRFADGECKIRVAENVRGKDVYIIQPTCPPVNENLMELLLMISTMRRASAKRITAVIPYYGYARQDRKMRARVPISAADVARLLECMGVDRIIAIDLHCGQIQGFFSPRVPVDNLAGASVGVQYFGIKDLQTPCVISPDAGGVYRAKNFRDELQKMSGHEISLAMIVKQRVKANEISQMDLVGSVDGKDCILVDDMIDTAGTLCKAAEELKKAGARRVFAFASHGLFSGPANDRILASDLDEVVVANTIPLNEETMKNPKIVHVSVAPLLGEAIARIHAKTSVSKLFTACPPLVLSKRLKRG